MCNGKDTSLSQVIGLMIYLLFLISTFVNTSLEEHAIYLSTIKSIYVDDHLRIEIRVFEDDLRDALRSSEGQHPDTSSTLFDQRLEQYLNRQITISNQQEKVELSLVKKRLVGDSFQVDLVSNSFRYSNQLDLSFSYFFELFPTQQNVLHFRKGEEEWYHIFKKGNEKWTLNF